MRNLLGTAVAVVLSMVLLPNCCSTANAGMSVSVSVGPSAEYEYPAEYTTEECGYPESNNEAVNWDNAFVINDNRIGMWVWLPVGRWVVRCCNIWYDSGWNEVRFGPWWYDYSIPFTYHFNNAYYNYCPFRTVRFHDYMNLHYSNWHNRYFVYNHDRYQPRAEQHIVVSHIRYGQTRNDAPVVHRQSAEQVKQCRPVTDERTIIINHESKQPVKIDGGNRTERIDNNNKGNCRQSEASQNRSEKIDSGNKGNNGNYHQSEVTRTRSVTKEHSNGCGNGSTMTRTNSRSSTTIHNRGR